MISTLSLIKSNLIPLSIQQLSTAEYNTRQNFYRSDAIDTFGVKLADSLRKSDGSWETVITSKTLFLTLYETLQQYSSDFDSFSKEIEFITQSKDGIILEYRPIPDCGSYSHLPADRFLGHLITPYGTLEIVFKKDPKNFLNLSRKFFVTELQTYYPRYSLTLNPHITATIKNPSRGFRYGIKFEDQLPKQMSSYEYSEMDIDQICIALNDKYPRLEITPKKYLLRGLCGEWL